MNTNLLYEVIRAAIYGGAALFLVSTGNQGWFLFLAVAVYGLFFSNLIFTLMLRIQALYGDVSEEEVAKVEEGG